MTFKQPNLAHSDDPAIAAAASDLLERRTHGTTTCPSDLKVLWMDDDCALVKRNAFSYEGSGYSGSVPPGSDHVALPWNPLSLAPPMR